MSKKRIIGYFIVAVIIVLVFLYFQNQLNSATPAIKCPPGQQVYYDNCSCSYKCLTKLPEQGCPITDCTYDKRMNPLTE